MRSRSRLFPALVCSLGLLSWQSVYYKTMKSLSKEKRDILVKHVIESKKGQQETKEKLQTTLESFQQRTGFQGGDLEKAHKKLNS
jgi:Protein of unknown function (DUF2959)